MFPSPCSPSPDHCSLQFFVDCSAFLRFLPYTALDSIHTVFRRFLHTYILLALFIPHTAPVPIRTASGRRLPHVLPSISHLLPILRSPDYSFVDAVTPSPPCPSSPFLPHTALTLNSALNLHFADRRRCHDDTNTHCSCRRLHGSRLSRVLTDRRLGQNQKWKVS